MFYFKLAWANIRKNKNTYIPFLGSMVFLVILNLLMEVMVTNQGIRELPQAETVHQLFLFGRIVIMIFSVIFSFYTNSFLIKRRQKELGLYNILGMDKKSLGVMLLVENFLSLMISLVLGIGFGVIFSKYLFLVLKKMTDFGDDFVFQLAPGMFVFVIGLFVILFGLLLFNNIFQLIRNNPIELLHGSDVGEKEPKAHWILTLLGLGSLGGGYYLALSIKDPMTAIPFFFAAIVLVIVGTYLILITASVTLLKFARKRRSLYYRPKPFINISGMIYRMKQNGAGLASICILCTMVLVTVSSTAGLFFGQENILRNRNPYDIELTTQKVDDSVASAVAKLAQEHQITVDQTYNLTVPDSLVFSQKNGHFKEQFKFVVNDDSAMAVGFLTLRDYQAMTGKKMTLQADEALLYVASGKITAKRLYMGGKTFSVKKKLKEFPGESPMGDLMKNATLIVKDEAVIEEIFAGLKGADGAATKPNFGTQLAMNISGSEENKMAFAKAVEQYSSQLNDAHSKEKMPNKTMVYSQFSSLDQDRAETNSFTGGFLFMGIVFGLAFLIATALIIYYKQISEGYDDARRFDIMQKVGMSHKEVRQTILSQVLMVFVIPIALAVLHLVVAMPVIKKLLVLFGLTDGHLIDGITIICIGAFALCYLAVYLLTSRSYYRIVERRS